MGVPPKLKLELLYEPAIPFLCGRKTLTPKDVCTCMFTAALFTIAEIWKQLKCPQHMNEEKVNVYSLLSLGMASSLMFLIKSTKIGTFQLFIQLSNR